MKALLFSQFDQAKIHKEYFKDGIKYLKLLYREENSNKVIVIDISYKRYLLQKYLGYLIPQEHKVIHLDDNIENFDIYNLGIRDENNESPVYKEWRIKRISNKSGRITKIITLVSDTNTVKNLPYHYYLFAKHLGREILKDEIFIFKNKKKEDLNVNNFTLKRSGILKSNMYNEIVRGPYRYKNGSLHVRLNKFKLSYARFLVQEHLGRLLNDNEIVYLKEPNNFNLDNFTILTTNYFTSNLYKNVRCITGPYYKKRGRHTDEQYDRQKIRIHFLNGKYNDMSYPKFIMQEHLGRFLTEDETVHHKDGDYYNNEISNLEILERSEHSKLDTLRLFLPKLKCQVCGKEFELSRSRWRTEIKKFHNQKNYKGPFCSFQCSKRAEKNWDQFLNILPDKKYYTLSGTVNEMDLYRQQLKEIMG